MNRNRYTSLLLGIGLMGTTTACNLQAILLGGMKSNKTSNANAVAVAAIEAPSSAIVKDFEAGENFYLDLDALDSDGVSCKDTIWIESVTVKTSRGAAVSDRSLVKSLDRSGKLISLEVDFGSIDVGTYVISVTVKSSKGSEKTVTYQVNQNSKPASTWKVTNVYSIKGMDFPYFSISDALSDGVADKSAVAMTMDSLFDADGEELDPNDYCMGMTSDKFGFTDFICSTEVVNGTLSFSTEKSSTTTIKFAVSSSGGGTPRVSRTYDASKWADANTSTLYLSIPVMTSDRFIGAKEDFAYLKDLKFSDGDATCTENNPKGGGIIGYTCTWNKSKPSAGTMVMVSSDGKTTETIGIVVK